MRIAVCAPQVPFVRGGAEIMAETLVAELRLRDHEAELVTVPFKWYPGTRVLEQAFLWRLLDLTESDGRPIDLVLALPELVDELVREDLGAAAHERHLRRRNGDPHERRFSSASSSATRVSRSSIRRSAAALKERWS